MKNNTFSGERRVKSLKRSSVTVSVIFIIAITMFIIPNKTLIPTSIGATLYVPTDYPTIQDAINASHTGDTVFVYSGTYYESLVVNKTINLIGEDRDFTTINGYGPGGKDVITITENWANVTNFTITQDGPQIFGSSIGVDSNYNTISGNKFFMSQIAIYLRHSIGNNITANTMIENGIYIIGDQLDHWNTHNIDTSNTVYGKPVYYWKNQTGGTIPPGAGQVILANCTNVIVENQRLTNGSVGIELGFSSNNNITSNTASSNNRYGIMLYSSSENNISGNRVEYHLFDGLYLNNSNRNNILGNIVLGNDNGIHLDTSDGNAITGNTHSSNSGCGILLEHSDGNYITDNYVSGNGHGIWLLQYSMNNTIENNTCKYSFYGIIVDTSNWNNITGNNASDNMHGIRVWGAYGPALRNNVVGNTAMDNNFDGISLIISSGNNITGNIAYSNSGHGIYLHGNCTGNYITSNNVISNEDYGIYIRDSADNEVISNEISSNHYEGIKLEHSIWNNIFDNNISNNERGISLSALSNNNVISDNQILSNKYDGILFESSLDNKITDNNISDNLEGVNVTSSSDNNIISGNQVSNKGHGIRVSSSSYNTLTGNNVSSNNLDGLRLLSFSNWNSIIGNTIFSNGNYGFYINGSSDNSIYHNNILDNINQAYDDTNNGNQWDNGYPSGGNYWSDFDEPSEGAFDDYNGPDQNVLSGDGIVDKGFGGGGGKNPYVIDLDSQDDYPLMGPYKNYMILKQGWNLISMPSIQQEQNLTKVLASIEGLYDAVQWCDITDTKDPWKHYRPGKPYGNDLFKIKETMGFWIHIIPPGDTIFYYNGIKPSQNQKITLHPGWNMVGYPSLSNKIRTAALNNINFGSDVDSIWTHNAATQKWEEIGPSDYFEIGRGYWIHSKVTKIWDVPI